MVLSCQLGQNPKSSEQLPQGTHKGVVKEVLQTTNYTYLLLTESKTETWVALPKMEAKAGDTYYYTEGMEMNNFESKELGRTIETVYFIQSVSTTLDEKSSETMAYPHSSKATKAEKAKRKRIAIFCFSIIRRPGRNPGSPTIEGGMSEGLSVPRGERRLFPGPFQSPEFYFGLTFP